MSKNHGSFELSDEQIMKVLTDQADKAVNHCYDNIVRGIDKTVAFTKLKIDMTNIIKGVIVYPL